MTRSKGIVFSLRKLFSYSRRWELCCSIYLQTVPFQIDCGNHPFCFNLFDTRDLWRPLTIYSSFLTSVDFAFQQKHSNKVDQRVSLSKRQVLTSNAINLNLSLLKLLCHLPYQWRRLAIFPTKCHVFVDSRGLKTSL